MRSPTIAPETARIKTSVKSWAATDAREAPSENRTEVACWRAVARERSKAAIFVHAIRSSSETDPNRSHNDFLAPPTVAFFRDSRETDFIASVFGNSRPR